MSSEFVLDYIGDRVEGKINILKKKPAMCFEEKLSRIKGNALSAFQQ